MQSTNAEYGSRYLATLHVTSLSLSLKSLNLNTLINPIELDPNKIPTRFKGVVYPFSNTIESACKSLIGMKTETEMTAHVQ